MIWLLLAAAWAQDTHVVRAGDTLEDIATALGADPELVHALRDLNGLSVGDPLVVGATLRLPGPTEGYRVQVQQPRVLSITGTGTATAPGRPPAPLESGMWLVAGTTVCTDRDSFLAVRLAVTTGTFLHDDISLLPETCLTVDSAVSRADRRSSVVSVSQGSVAVREVLEGDAGRVTVRTPAGATVGSKGGYRVTLEDDTARTEALYQPVAVVNAGEEQVLEAGQGVRTAAGEAPGEVVELLQQGMLIRPQDGVALRRPDFTWKPVERALGYRVEIATTLDFTHVVEWQEVADPEWHPEMLFVPYRVEGLWWRVSSFDKAGFQGVPSVPRRLAFPPGVGP